MCKGIRCKIFATNHSHHLVAFVDNRQETQAEGPKDFVCSLCTKRQVLEVCEQKGIPSDDFKRVNLAALTEIVEVSRTVTGAVLQ